MSVLLIVVLPDPVAPQFRIVRRAVTHFSKTPQGCPRQSRISASFPAPHLFQRAVLSRSATDLMGATELPGLRTVRLIVPGGMQICRRSPVGSSLRGAERIARSYVLPAQRAGQDGNVLEIGEIEGDGLGVEYPALADERLARAIDADFLRGRSTNITIASAQARQAGNQRLTSGPDGVCKRLRIPTVVSSVISYDGPTRRLSDYQPVLRGLQSFSSLIPEISNLHNRCHCLSSMQFSDEDLRRSLVPPHSRACVLLCRRLRHGCSCGEAEHNSFGVI